MALKIFNNTNIQLIIEKRKAHLLKDRLLSVFIVMMKF